MDAQAIDTGRMKTVRKARKMTRAKLAKRAGLTERQVTKLETASPATAVLPEESIAKISAALEIPALALTGELDLDASDLEQLIPKASSCGCCP